MGLPSHVVDAIAREHAYRPINGDVLFIGRQSIPLTPSELVQRLGRHCTDVSASAVEIDRLTWHRDMRRVEQVYDRSIFRALGNDKVKALDASNYEGAEVVHDLNKPIPDHLHGTADFVVDGSSLDNVFDPAMALRNFADLLRPGGRLLMTNAWSTRAGIYTACSPCWFFDFFVTAGFSDCRLYLCISDRRRIDAYWLDPAFMASPDARTKIPILSCWWRSPSILLLAEKASTQCDFSLPMQGYYRSEKEWSEYLHKLEPIRRSNRPHIIGSTRRSLPSLQWPRSRGHDFATVTSCFLPTALSWIDENFVARPTSKLLSNTLSGSLDFARLVRRRIGSI